MRRFIPRPSLWKYYSMWCVIHTIGVMPLKYRYAVSRFMSDRVYNWRTSIRNNIRSNVRQVLGPDASEELSLGRDTMPARHKHSQQFETLRCQGHDLSVTPQHTLDDIKKEGTERVAARARRGTAFTHVSDLGR